MTKKYIVAAALALSLSVSGTSVRAAEASVDLGSHIQQVIAEIHGGNADWNQMIGRIDRLVVHIDEQIEDGTGDYEQLQASRRRLLRAKANIEQQYLTTANYEGETAIGSAPCEVCGGFHSAPATGPAPLSFDGSTIGGGFSSGGGVAGGGGGGGMISGGGGGGLGGFGGIGILGGIGAAIAIAFDDDDNDIGIIASPSN